MGELKLKNRVAVITGAAGAIGSTVVRRLSKGGWKIASIDLRKSSAELALQVDVRDRAAMVETVAETNKRLGPISLLVTAAGIFETAPMGRMSVDRWRRLLDVWLGGTRNACAAVLPEMLLLGQGTVVTLSAGPSNCDESNAYYAAATIAFLAGEGGPAFAGKILQPNGGEVRCSS